MAVVMLLMLTAICNMSGAGTHGRSKGLVPCVLVRILLTVVHLLFECLRLLLVAE